MVAGKSRGADRGTLNCGTSLSEEGVDDVAGEQKPAAQPSPHYIASIEASCLLAPPAAPNARRENLGGS